MTPFYVFAFLGGLVGVYRIVSQMFGTPTQFSLDRLFKEANAVRILKGGARDGQALEGPLLAEFQRPDELEQLREALAIDESDTGFVCMCSGDLAIQFMRDSTVLTTVAFHHHSSLLHPKWTWHARLKDGPALARFLAKHGVEGPLQEYQQERELRTRSLEAQERWKANAPRCLAHKLKFYEQHPKQAMLELSKYHPNPADRCALLWRWLEIGSGDEYWDWIPDYEIFAHNLIDMHDEAQIKSSIQANLHDSVAIRGAGKYLGRMFGAPHFHQKTLKELPENFWERLPEAFESGVGRDNITKFVRWMKARNSKESRSSSE